MKKLIKIGKDYVEVETRNLEKVIISNILNSKSFRKSIEELVNHYLYSKKNVETLIEIITKRLIKLWESKK